MPVKENLFLLAGEGPSLRVFHHESKELRLVYHAFNSQVIHDIIARELSESSEHAEVSVEVLVGGGRCMRMIKLSFQLGDIRKVRVSAFTDPYVGHDWVVDACFLPLVDSTNAAASGTRAVFLTDQNVLFSVQLHHGPDFTIPSRLHVATAAAGPPSVLYSAHIKIIGSGQLLVATGTVFGAVSLWSTSIEDVLAKSGTSRARPSLYSFPGHEGSVFGVRISEVFRDSSENGPRRFMASCSDDRSIRIWDISEVIQRSQTALDDENKFTVEETGFSNPDAVAKSTGTGRVASAMGHLSRIWSLRFLPGQDQVQRLLSFGEDATVQEWVLPPKNLLQSMDNPSSLTFAYNYGFHSGKNIWSADLCTYNGSHLVATGGSDGRIVSSIIPSEDSYIPGMHHSRWKILQVGNDQSHGTPICIKQSTHGSGTSDSILAARLAFLGMGGNWKLARSLKSALSAYPSGTFTGKAKFMSRAPTDEAYDAEYLYLEEGTLVTEKGLSIHGSRHYAYRYQEETATISAWFVKVDDPEAVDYLFHKIEFEEKSSNDLSHEDSQPMKATGHHLCVDDFYDAEYKFDWRGERFGSWSIGYSVKGPKKDYTTNAIYTLENDDPNSNNETPSRLRGLIATFDLPLNIGEKDMLDDREDSFKGYAWISSRQFLATTSHGRILLGILQESNSVEDSIVSTMSRSRSNVNVSWSHIALLPELRSYSVITSIPSCGLAILGSSHGEIFCYKAFDNSIELLTNIPKKVSAAFANVSEDTNQVFVAIISPDPKIAFVLVIDGIGENRGPIRLIKSFVLDLPPAFVVTAFNMFGQNQILMALGSRSGALALFKIELSGDNNAMSTLRHAHGRDAITSINKMALENGDGEQTQYIQSTGRDGQYAIHRVSNTEDTTRTPKVFAVQKVHVSRPPFGPNIEGARYFPKEKQLLIWGFRSTKFIVWNATKQQEIMNVDCGGSHRSWSYVVDEGATGGGRLVWTKSSTCHVHSQSRASHEILQPGSHGREITAMATTVFRDESGGVHRMLATGAEDTTIRIAWLSDDDDDDVSDYNHRLSQFATLNKHTTGVQGLKWSPMGNYLFTAGGCEEFFVWKVQPIPGYHPGVLCHSVCKSVTEAKDLRIMDFDIMAVSDEKGSSPVDNFLVVTVYSDSSIRAWLFDANKPEHKFSLLFTGTYSTCCLTQIRIVTLEVEIYAIAAGTDGHMMLWRMTQALIDGGLEYNNGEVIYLPNVPRPTTCQELAWERRIPLHQSSIQSMTVVNISKVDILLATGGDDNALAFTRLSLDTDNPINSSPPVIPSAHAGAITAIQHTTLPPPPNSSSEAETEARIIHTFRLFTTSTDQRLKTWIVTFDPSQRGVEGLDINRTDDVHSTVADVHCMELLVGSEDGGGDGGGEGEREERRKEKERPRVSVCLAGVGIEIVNVE